VCDGQQRIVDQAKAYGNAWDMGGVPGHPQVEQNSTIARIGWISAANHRGFRSLADCAQADPGRHPRRASCPNSVYYYNNAAPSTAAPAAATASNSTSVTYRSYSVELASNTGFYYYSPGLCGCYYYAPGPSPTAATSAATPNGTALAGTVANAPGTYRSFSPDLTPAANYPATNYYYSYPGTYYRSTSSGGHSWGGRR
jgi:hypothetical protein